MTSILKNLLRSSPYGLTQFSKERIEDLEKRVEMRAAANGDVPYIQCRVRNRRIKLTPEEVVRQLYLDVLIDDLGYGADRIRVEHPVHFEVVSIRKT